MPWSVGRPCFGDFSVSGLSMLLLSIFAFKRSVFDNFVWNVISRLIRGAYIVIFVIVRWHIFFWYTFILLLPWYFLPSLVTQLPPKKYFQRVLIPSCYSYISRDVDICIIISSLCSSYLVWHYLAVLLTWYLSAHMFGFRALLSYHV